jgi:MoaA/NifB/PqqE/SkfB family radical SAM enzyme
MEKIIKVPRMQIYCNSSCQLNCNFCAKSFQKIPQVSLSLTRFYTIASILIDFGINQFELSPIVGESFLDPHILERVIYLSNHESVEKIVIFTNLLNYDLVRDVLRYPKVELNVSIYGIDRTSYTDRTGKNGYDVFIDNLFNLLNFVQKNNIKDQIILYIRCPYEKKKGYNLADKFEVCYNIAKFSGIQIWEASEDTNWEKMIKSDSDSYNPERCGICRYAIEDNCVFPNGDITICGWYDVNKYSIIGNIFKQSLEEIYSIKSRYFKLLMEQNEKTYQGICKGCTIYKAQPINTCVTLGELYGNYVSNYR